MLKQMLKQIEEYILPKYKFKQDPLSWEDMRDNYATVYAEREIEYNKNKNLWNVLEDWSYDIHYMYRGLWSMWYSFLEGLQNLWKYRKVVWQDRWYDHRYLMTMLRFKLQDMHDNWDNSHYLEHNREKADIALMLSLIDKYNELSDFDSYDEKQQTKKEFFDLLSDKLENLWD